MELSYGLNIIVAKYVYETVNYFWSGTMKINRYLWLN